MIPRECGKIAPRVDRLAGSKSGLVLCGGNSALVLRARVQSTLAVGRRVLELGRDLCPTALDLCIGSFAEIEDFCFWYVAGLAESGC